MYRCADVTDLNARLGAGFEDAFITKAPGSTVYKQYPAIRIIPGNTYKFVMVDVEAEHLFYISTSPIGNGAGRVTEGITNDLTTVEFACFAMYYFVLTLLASG
jgi:hypothetical protein